MSSYPYTTSSKNVSYLNEEKVDDRFFGKSNSGGDVIPYPLFQELLDNLEKDVSIYQKLNDKFTILNDRLQQIDQEEAMCKNEADSVPNSYLDRLDDLIRSLRRANSTYEYQIDMLSRKI